MRHRVYGKHLGRDKNQRTALFKSLVGALILHGSIETTETKAKAIKGLVDRVITQAKSKNTRDLVSSYLTQKSVQEKLFKEVVPAVSKRNSGYTSVVKLGRRLGDNAMKVRMTILMEEKKEEKKETQRHPELDSGSNKKIPKQVRNDKPRVPKKVSKK